MQIDEGSGQMHRIGRNIPSNHHAHNLNDNSHPASISVAEEDHAALLVSDLEMQIPHR